MPNKTNWPWNQHFQIAPLLPGNIMHSKLIGHDFTFMHVALIQIIWSNRNSGSNCLLGCRLGHLIMHAGNCHINKKHIHLQELLGPNRRNNWILEAFVLPHNMHGNIRKGDKAASMLVKHCTWWWSQKCMNKSIKITKASIVLAVAAFPWLQINYMHVNKMYACTKHQLELAWGSTTTTLKYHMYMHDIASKRSQQESLN